jgi:hypothetical protein
VGSGTHTYGIRAEQFLAEFFLGLITIIARPERLSPVCFLEL